MAVFFVGGGFDEIRQALFFLVLVCVLFSSESCLGDALEPFLLRSVSKARFRSPLSSDQR